MKRHLTGMGLAIALSISATQAHAVANTVAMGGLIQQTEQSASNIIADLDNVVSARAFQVRTEMMFLISELNAMSGELVGKTFGELDESQKTFFENAQIRLDEIDTMIGNGFDQADDIVDHAEHIVAQVPFTKKEPRVRTTAPTYLASYAGDGNDSTVITIQGSFLNHGDPILTMGTAQCDLKAHADNEAMFLCPSAQFVAFDNVNHIAGTLNVVKKRSWWNKLWGKKDYKDYRVATTVVPEKMADFTVTAVVNTIEFETRKRQGKWGHVNPHCRRHKTTVTSFGPAGEGWKIQPETIALRKSNSRRGSHRLENVSENGFQVRASAKNKGDCIWPTRDARGAEEGYVTWVEKKPKTVPVKETLGEGELAWGKDMAIDLFDKELVGYKVIVTKITGDELIFIGEGSRDWATVTVDANQTSLLLSPKSLKDAMAL